MQTMTVNGCLRHKWIRTLTVANSKTADYMASNIPPPKVHFKQKKTVMTPTISKIWLLNSQIRLHQPRRWPKEAESLDHTTSTPSSTMNLRQLLMEFSVCLRRIIYNVKKMVIKIYQHKIPVVFNSICIKDHLLSKYTELKNWRLNEKVQRFLVC